MSVKKTASKIKNWEPNPNLTTEELETMRVEVLDRIVIARGYCFVIRFLEIWQHV
jgi:hypothetical protein